MALYCFVKEEPKKSRKIVSLISYTSLFTGAFFLFWSLYPLISFEIYSALFLRARLLTPIPRSDIASSLAAANNIMGAYNLSSSNLSDYTKAGIWFPAKKQKQNLKPKINEYLISIPKLNIFDAKVIVGGEDLTAGLIHYLPTSYPGEYGNVAIFGHSTLTALSKPNDYRSIFTYLPSLERGDEILVKMNDNNYKYKVYEMFVVKPDQVSVLDQQFDNSYLSLITCVPPGLLTNRLVVRARLERI